MLSVVISKFLNPVTLFMVVIQTIFCHWPCVLSGLQRLWRKISDGMVKYAGIRRWQVSFMAMVGLVYLVFCVIQIVYLFMGKGQPAGGG